MASKTSKSLNDPEIEICDSIKNSSFGNERKSLAKYKINKKISRFDSDYIFILKIKNGDYFDEELGINKGSHRFNDEEFFDEMKDGYYGK